MVSGEDRDRIAQETMEKSRGRVLIVADPTQTLKLAPIEAAMVARRASGRAVEAPDPTELHREDLAAAAGRTEILHLISHGTFDEANPFCSGIYLRDSTDAEAIWSNADIFSGVTAPAGRLAVLSACDTARTKPNLVSEDVSLPAALLAAGYAAVIGSRWHIADLSTSLLMGEFYRIWFAGGVAVDQALAEARRWLRAMDRSKAAQRILALPEELGFAREHPDLATLCFEVGERVATGPDLPFEEPEHWAAFFVTGDGSITADGEDPRLDTVP
jgi:CHAT domain-containing protein